MNVEVSQHWGKHAKCPECGVRRYFYYVLRINGVEPRRLLYQCEKCGALIDFLGNRVHIEKVGDYVLGSDKEEY